MPGRLARRRDQSSRSNRPHSFQSAFRTASRMLDATAAMCPKVQRNFGHIAAVASSMRDAVQKADWNECGRLLREDWSRRRANLPGISTPLIDRLITLAKRAGSLGAKVCGAGGGGCVFFLVERGAQERVARAIAAAGAEILPVQVAARGVTIRKSPREGTKSRN